MGSAPGKQPGGNPGAAAGDIPAMAAAECDGEVDAAIDAGGEGAENTDDVGECAEWKEAMVSHTGGMVGHFSLGVRCNRGSLSSRLLVPIFAAMRAFYFLINDSGGSSARRVPVAVRPSVLTNGGKANN